MVLQQFPCQPPPTNVTMRARLPTVHACRPQPFKKGQIMAIDQARRPLLEARNLKKRFGGVEALCGASLTIEEGETMALVGGNGTGKSTFVKAIAGVQPADSGEILLRGQRVRIKSPKDAGRLGIEVVYQELALADSVDVPGNVFLGNEPLKFKLGLFSVPDYRRMEREATATLDRLRMKVPDTRRAVGTLSGGQRQAVAISRSIRKQDSMSLLILDEPTASLGVEEVCKVLSLLQTLRANHQTMLVVSHNLEHVFQVSNRIAVMGSGQVQAVRKTSESTKTEILRLIVGDIEERQA
jgi:ABC-type sugar transport system ATPase subunit